MRWKVDGRRTMYESDWVNVYLDDVELPDGSRIDHHVLTMPKASQTALVLDDNDRVLLIWRHRFITDQWGWEVPAGWAEPGEDPVEAIRREILEETGYSTSTVQRLAEYNALSGISTMHFTMYVATGVAWTGPSADSAETDKIEWHHKSSVEDLVRTGQVIDGPSLTTLAYFFAFGRA